MEDTMMAKPLLTDELWERIKRHIPPEPPKPEGGRPRIPDRAALSGILFVLQTGTPWKYLPQEMGCGSGWMGGGFIGRPPFPPPTTPHGAFLTRWYTFAISVKVV